MRSAQEMRWETIQKRDQRTSLEPNLGAYDDVSAHFSWDLVRQEFDGLPGSAGLNIAHECVDRHAASQLRGKVAVRWLGKDRSSKTFTYQALSEWSSRFANVLTQLGVAQGERVFSLLGRVIERPWIVNHAVAPRPIVTATLSADHRVTDGHRGAVFLSTLDRLLQKVVQL